MDLWDNYDDYIKFLIRTLSIFEMIHDDLI